MPKSQPGTAKRRTVLAAVAAAVAAAAVGGTQTDWRFGLGGGDPATNTGDPGLDPTGTAPAPAGNFFRPAGGVPHFMAHFHALDEDYWNPTRRDSTGNKAAQPWLAAHLDGLRSLGVDGVRIDLGWSAIAPNSPGELKWNTFHLHRLLQVQDMLAERGMSMILVPQRSPAWARPGTDPNNPNQFPTNLGAVTDFASQLVTKLDSNVVKAIEAWNEPNLGEFSGVPKEERPRRYAEVLKAFHAGVGGKFPVVFAGPSRNDAAFLDAALTFKPPCEAIGAHPYMADQSLPANTPVEARLAEQYTQSYPSMRDVARRHGYGDRPHGFTEFGVSVHENEPGLEKQFRGATVDVAVASLGEAFDLAQRTGGSFTVYYAAYRPPSQSDGPLERKRHRAGMSLLDQDGNPLPHARKLSEHVQRRRQEAGVTQTAVPRRTAANMPASPTGRSSSTPTR